MNDSQLSYAGTKPLRPIASRTIGATDGAQGVRLESESVQVTIEPRCGGKTTSLFDRRAGVEWLWRNPRIGVREPGYGESYVERLDSGGWDEIFPSVQPCDVQLGGGANARVPDHGDLVQLPWEVTDQTRSRLDTQVAGRCLPFEFFRRMDLLDDELVLSYCVRNTGNRAFPWIWCAHPLLPLNSITSVDTHCSFRVVEGHADAQSMAGRTVSWEEMPSRDRAWAAKLFSPSLATDAVTISHERGAALRIAWDPSELPHLALWVNNGGWSGIAGEPYFNLGVEPTNAPGDHVGRCDQAPMLAPGQTVTWSLSVRLLSGHDAAFPPPPGIRRHSS